MTTPKRVGESWAAAWSSHDAEKLLVLFTDDCVYEDVTFGVVTRGKKELRAFAEGAFAAIPDLRFQVTGEFIRDRSGGFEWLMSGTHKGDFPGLPATGKKFTEIRGATIVELHGDKIRRDSDYWDAATFMKQVGLLK